MKAAPVHNSGNANGDKEEEGIALRLNEISKNFISDCEAEKERLGEDFPLAAMLVDQAIDKVLTTGRIPGREMHADVFKQKAIKVTQKVFVPIKQFPKFNFIGKILGPKGNSLRRLQEETLCRIAIKGRNSMRDSEKEEELRMSGDSRHAHLSKDLYVEISTVATPAEAYARVAFALSEIRKYLIPDKNDDVSMRQMKESMADPESAEKAAQYAGKFSAKSGFKGTLNKNRSVSILEKLTGKTAEKPEDVGEDLRLNYNSAPLRTFSQKTPIKRGPSDISEQIQRYQTPQKRVRDTAIGGQPKSSPMVSLKRHR